MATFLSISFALVGVLGATYYFFVYQKQKAEEVNGQGQGGPGGNNTVKWLVDDNELIPFNEIDKRRSYVNCCYR